MPVRTPAVRGEDGPGAGARGAATPGQSVPAPLDGPGGPGVDVPGGPGVDVPGGPGVDVPGGRGGGACGVDARRARTGELVLVATPIGNLGDLSARMVDVLAAADLICCEDTRRTRQLLTHAGVHGRTLMAVHEHNERSQTPRILEHLARGETVALVSDAGMPIVSDPGAWVVTQAIDAGYRVGVVPGPSAVLAALAVSGLPARRFCFEGFLPRRGAERGQRLAALSEEERTAVLYEAPGRVPVTLADLAATCGPQRAVAVARELTKLHEEVWRGSLGDAVQVFTRRAEEAQLRGEVVVVLAGKPASTGEVSDPLLSCALRERLDRGSSVRDAVAGAVAELGVARRRAYPMALSLASEPRQASGDRRASPGLRGGSSEALGGSVEALDASEVPGGSSEVPASCSEVPGSSSEVPASSRDVPRGK